MKVTIVGGSGYVGGELLRILNSHPEVTEIEVTSERLQGRYVKYAHPNLRRLNLKFTGISELKNTDLIMSCLPHGKIYDYIESYMGITDSIIDLSGDFRLKSPSEYQRYYGREHPYPELLDSFVYGIPELHRKKMRGAPFISSAGCNATASILPLKPLLDKGIISDVTLIDVKVGVSEAGKQSGNQNNFVERTRSVRSYKLTGHRHAAEIRQELKLSTIPPFSATSIPIIRGVLATIQSKVQMEVEEKEIWRAYREAYQDEPFIDLVKEKSGNYRFPDPKTLMGSNTAQIGFEIDKETGRLVVVSAIDNLMKGAAGQAVQSMNIMFQFEETTGIYDLGFYIF